MEDVKLLGAWPSPFSYRVIWSLKHKGVDYEYIEEDLSNKSEHLLRYNPVHKMIPVLVHGGNPIVESTIILEYIEETWPQNPLFPADPYEKAHARFWINYGEQKNPDFMGIFHTVGEEQAEATNRSKELLKIIEKHCLGENKFFGGDKIGMVDIYFGWIAGWLEVLEEAAGIQLLKSNCFPRLQAWIQEFKSVPVINENLPNQHEMPPYFKRQREKIIASLAE